MSFRFYDPIALIINDRLSEDMKITYKLTNSIEKNIFERTDTKMRVMATLGMTDSEKLVHKPVDERLDHQDMIMEECALAQGVQISNYIAIDREMVWKM